VQAKDILISYATDDLQQLGVSFNYICLHQQMYMHAMDIRRYVFPCKYPGWRVTFLVKLRIHPVHSKANTKIPP
jgi:hypothetical protein